MMEGCPLIVSSHGPAGWYGEGLSLCVSRKALLSFMTAPFLGPNQLSKPPPPRILILGVNAPIYKFGDNIDIQFMTLKSIQLQ